MKKLVVTALSLLVCETACALPLSNPIGPSLYTEGLGWADRCLDSYGPLFCWLNAFDLEIGFYGDYVFNRNLELSNSSGGAGCMRNTTLWTNAGVVTLNMWDWMDVYVVMGSTHLTVTSSSFNFTTNAVGQYTTFLNFDPTFCWSVGAQAALFKCGCFGVGIEGQYFRTKPSLTSATTEQSIVYLNSNQSVYAEWQVGIGTSYCLMTRDCGVKFIPYLGVKWAGATLDMANQTYTTPSLAVFQLGNLQSSKLWGVAAGATLTMDDTIGFTVEGRWADETAIYINGQLRF